MPDVIEEVIINEVKCLDEIMDVRDEVKFMQAVCQDQERVITHVKAEAFFKTKPEITPIRLKIASRGWQNGESPSQLEREETTDKFSRQTFQEWIAANPDTLYDKALRQIQYSTRILDSMEKHANEIENTVSSSLKIMAL